MRDFTLAMVTLNVLKGQTVTMLDKIDAYATEARGADLLLLPEYAINGYVRDRQLCPRIALRADSPAIRRLGEIARANGLAVSAGFIEDSGSAYYNSQALLDRRGQLVGVYRKCNLSPKESPYFSMGDDYPVFDLGFCRLGYNVCFEAWFPESQRILALQGAEVILMPFTFAQRWERYAVPNPATTPDQIIALRRTRLNRSFAGAALANAVFIAYADHCGREVPDDPRDEMTYPGLNMAWDPLGEVLGESPGYVEGVTIVTMRNQTLDFWRGNDHLPLHWRRPSLYQPLTRPLTRRDLDFQKAFYRQNNPEYLCRFDRGT